MNRNEFAMIWRNVTCKNSSAIRRRARRKLRARTSVKKNSEEGEHWKKNKTTFRIRRKGKPAIFKFGVQNSGIIRRGKKTVLNKTTYCSFLFDSFLSFDQKKERKKKEPPVCVAYSTIITVKHILIERADLGEGRQKYSEERSLYSSLFRNVNPEKIFDNLKATGMFFKVRGVLK